MRDWNRRRCARRGHETYAPVGPGIETELAARLQVQTVHGPAWRCLRCGDYAIGEPAAGGPADEAPVVPRGKALRDLFILRLLAIERVVRGVVILLIAWAVWKFGSSQNAVQKLFEDDLTAFKPFANHFGWDVEHASIVERIRKTFNYSPKSIHTVALLLGGYALLETVEGIGLWLAKRWGEYLTAVGTSIFLPLEVWDGYNKIHEHKSYVFAICTFTINVGAVVYLLVSKRLFGIRGGGKAFEAQKHADALMTVELAACGGAGAGAGGGGSRGVGGVGAGVGAGADGAAGTFDAFSSANAATVVGVPRVPAVPGVPGPSNWNSGSGPSAEQDLAGTGVPDSRAALAETVVLSQPPNTDPAGGAR